MVAQFLLGVPVVQAADGAAYLQLVPVEDSFEIGADGKVQVVVKDIRPELTNGAKVRVSAGSGVKIVSIMEATGMLGIKAEVLDSGDSAKVDIAKVQSHFVDGDVVAIIVVRPLSVENASLSFTSGATIGSEAIDLSLGSLELNPGGAPSVTSQPIMDDDLPETPTTDGGDDSLIDKISRGLRGEGDAVYAYLVICWGATVLVLAALVIYLLKKRSNDKPTNY